MDYEKRTLSRINAEVVLHKLIGCSMCYGLKSPDICFYDIGFGECNVIEERDKRKRFLSSFAIHASCCIKIIEIENKKTSSIYSENTTSEEFHNGIEHLIGLTIKRISLSSKNDLWIDMGRYWLVIITYEDEMESWRFFSPIEESSHLVVTSYSIETSE